MIGVLALLAVTAVAFAARAAPVPPVSAPQSVRAGEPWIVTARSARGRPTVTATRGAVRRAARMRRVAKGRFRAALSLPLSGAWTYTVTAGKRMLARGSVLVRVGLENPLGIAVDAHSRPAGPGSSSPTSKGRGSCV